MTLTLPSSNMRRERGAAFRMAAGERLAVARQYFARLRSTAALAMS